MSRRNTGRSFFGIGDLIRRPPFWEFEGEWFLLILDNETGLGNRLKTSRGCLEREVGGLLGLNGQGLDSLEVSSRNRRRRPIGIRFCQTHEQNSRENPSFSSLALPVRLLLPVQMK